MTLIEQIGHCNGIARDVLVLVHDALFELTENGHLQGVVCARISRD
jgi:hypothetical protein